MTRHSLSIAFAFVSTLLMVGAAAGPALASPTYSAQPAVTPASAKLVIRDIVWNCGDAGCASNGRSNSRPAIVCAVLVKEVGALKSFAIGGEALAAEELEKCNAKAQ